MSPTAVAQPTRAGSVSLTRVLGLKVGRIVIDAGHGGHDTGTIGPTGLMEKDLSLDISLRLGRIIQERLPIAEVVFTREDDSFVALEQRTAIANDARSDLLVSIHANSSSDRRVRGIETYYLNFNPAPAAMEVASRENALAHGGVHQLEEMVQKIARNEKVEESRDLAASIQESLTRQTNAAARDRGPARAGVLLGHRCGRLAGGAVAVAAGSIRRISRSVGSFRPRSPALRTCYSYLRRPLGIRGAGPTSLHVAWTTCSVFAITTLRYVLPGNRTSPIVS